MKSIHSIGWFLALIALAGMGLHPCHASESPQAATSDASARKVADQFLAIWCTTQTNGAFDQLLQTHWYRPEEAADIAKQTDAQHEKSAAQDTDQGKRLPDPIEFVGSRQLGNSQLKLIYIERYERKADPWAFVFYRAQADWKLVGILEGEGAREDVYGVAGDATTGIESVKQVTERFMKDLLDGRDDEAFSELVQNHSLIPDKEGTATRQFASGYRGKKALAELRMGKRLPNGYDLLCVRQSGQSLLKLVYLEKHAFGALPFRFTFYRPQGEWKLYDLTFGDAVPIEELTSAAIVRRPTP